MGGSRSDRIQTDDDPTAGGWFCGAKRSEKQTSAEGDDGHPWCRKRAGHGTDHPGAGRCRNHAGTTPNHRVSVYRQMAEAIAEGTDRMLQILQDETATPLDWVRAFREVADRGGLPRHSQVSVEDVTELGLERLLDLQRQFLDEEDDGESQEGTEHGRDDSGGAGPDAGPDGAVPD